MRLRRAEEGSPATAVQLLRALEAMQGEQGEIRAEVTALRDRARSLPDADAVEAIREGQEELRRKVEQLELWLTRLDGRLGDMDLAAQGAGTGRLDRWQAVLIAALASASSAALAVVVARFYLAL
jgi:hypothetical protein